MQEIWGVLLLAAIGVIAWLLLTGKADVPRSPYRSICNTVTAPDTWQKDCRWPFGKRGDARWGFNRTRTT